MSNTTPQSSHVIDEGEARINRPFNSGSKAGSSTTPYQSKPHRHIRGLRYAHPVDLSGSFIRRLRR